MSRPKKQGKQPEKKPSPIGETPQHLTFEEVKFLAEDICKNLSFPPEYVTCHRISGNGQEKDSVTDCYKSVAEQLCGAKYPIHFSIIYEEYRYKNTSGFSEPQQDHFYLAMKVYNKFYVLDSLGRGDRHIRKYDNRLEYEAEEFELPAHKVLFDLLEGKDIYSNSANLQADNYSCASYALEIMKREMQLIQSFVSNFELRSFVSNFEQFNDYMTKYFNEEAANVQGTSFHKSKVIGEIPVGRWHILGNIKLYAIPNELATLAQSKTYLKKIKNIINTEIDDKLLPIALLRVDRLNFLFNYNLVEANGNQIIVNNTELAKR